MSNKEAITGLIGVAAGAVAGFLFGTTYNLLGGCILALLGAAAGWTFGRMLWH